MKKDYSYVREKLFDAINRLAVGSGDARSRLLKAYLACHTLRETHFPEALRQKWVWITKQLTRYPEHYDYRGKIDVGRIENTTRNIQNRTAVKIAKELFGLYSVFYHSDKYK